MGVDLATCDALPPSAAYSKVPRSTSAPRRRPSHCRSASLVPISLTHAADMSMTRSMPSARRRSHSKPASMDTFAGQVTSPTPAPPASRRILKLPAHGNRRRASDLWRYMATYLHTSGGIKEHQQHLHRIKVEAATAARRRAQELIQEQRAQRRQHPSSPTTARAIDSQQHVLELQAMWFEAALDMTQTACMHQARSLRLPLQHFLGRFLDTDGIAHVPTSADSPSMALVEFEALVHAQHLIPTCTLRHFDRLCCDTMANSAFSSATAIWQERASSEVMPALCDEIVAILREHAQLTSDLEQVLRLFVEQMVFSRLAKVAYTPQERDAQLDEWQQLCSKAIVRSCREFGVPSTLRDAVSGSIAAFERLPYLVPTSMLAALKQAMRVLRGEISQLLPSHMKNISDRRLVRCLAYVLTRCDLPHLPAQVTMLQQFAQLDGRTARMLTTVSDAIALVQATPVATQ